MVVNPALKPRVATAGLVLTSAVVLIFLALVPLAILASELPTAIKIVLASVLLASALMLLWLWWKRYAKRRTWAANAEARWRSFNNARATSGTTTEVTLLSIDAVQPTGAWVTIMWNRFNHIQPAWIETTTRARMGGTRAAYRSGPYPGHAWSSVASDVLAYSAESSSSTTSRISPAGTCEHPGLGAVQPGAVGLACPGPLLLGQAPGGLFGAELIALAGHALDSPDLLVARDASPGTLRA